MELTEANKRDISNSMWEWFHAIDGKNLLDILASIYWSTKNLTPQAVADKLKADPAFVAAVQQSTSAPRPTYVFAAGDSVCGLAARYGTTAEALETLNGLDTGEQPAVASVVKLR